MKMKRIFLCFLTTILLLSGCGGGMAQIELQDNNPIPEDGILSVSLLEQMRKDSAIAVFHGESNGFYYEWTIFGKEISDPQPVDLRISAASTGDGMEIGFSQADPFGFPALLSVYLNETWNAQGATAYQNAQPIRSVSLTSTAGKTILNLAAEGLSGNVQVLSDRESGTDSASQGSAEATQTADPSYLSQTQSGNSQVYTDTAGKGTVVSGQNPGTQTEDYLSGPQQGSSQVYGEIIQGETISGNKVVEDESYLSNVTDSGGRVYSDGSSTIADKYFTDPVPAGKPMPVEPENQQINQATSYTCTFSIECSTILNNLSMLDPDKREMVPSNGVILRTTTVTFYEGESVFDVLQRLCREKGIHLESSWTPIYNSAYIEGIHNLYEFDCGSLSGWMYKVNGWYPNYGCSRYQLEEGDVVEWRFTCDLGNDIGGAYAVGG